MIKRILLVSEGVSELGRRGDGRSLQILVKRILNESWLQNHTLDFHVTEITNPEIHRVRRSGKNSAYEKKLVACIIHAKNSGFDAVVIVIDRDGDQDRSLGIQAAQANPLPDLPRALGCAIESYESWLLSDEQALTVIKNETVHRQCDPEPLRPGQAKSLIESIIGEDGKAALYAAIAAIIDIAKIRERCPNSFEPFHNNLLNLFA